MGPKNKNNAVKKLLNAISSKADCLRKIFKKETMGGSNSTRNQQHTEDLGRSAPIFNLYCCSFVSFQRAPLEVETPRDIESRNESIIPPSHNTTNIFPSRNPKRERWSTMAYYYDSRASLAAHETKYLSVPHTTPNLSQDVSGTSRSIESDKEGGGEAVTGDFPPILANSPIKAEELVKTAAFHLPEEYESILISVIAAIGAIIKKLYFGNGRFYPRWSLRLKPTQEDVAYSFCAFRSFL